MKLYLASQSPRRRQLLDQIKVEYEILDVEIDEHWQDSENPKDYVVRMAQEKAQAGKSKINHEAAVLAADTSVILDNIILGKANTKDDAIRMLRQLSGRRHEVYTAVCLLSENEQTKLSISHVHFKVLTEKEIDDYCNSDEPIAKAGGYAIQGLAASFIERLEGSYSGVMGLPLYETSLLLSDVSILS